MPTGSGKEKEKVKDGENTDRKTRRESKVTKEFLTESHKPAAEAACKHSGMEEKFEKFQDEMRTLFKKLDDSIDQKINKLNEKFSNVYDELKAEIGTMKANIEANMSDIESINETLGDHEKTLEFNANQLLESENKQKKEMKKMEKSLDEKIKTLDQKLMLLEKQDRKYNLLFYGIPEEPGEKLYDKMRGYFVNDLGIDAERAQKIYFANGHRYPTRSAGPNPIILRFSCFDDRELVLSHAKNLVKTGKRILTDLPVTMKIERDRIAKIAYRIRRDEELQTRIKDKGLDLYLEVRKNRKDKWVKRDVEVEGAGV